MPHLQNLINSFIQHIPKIKNLSAMVQRRKNIIVNYPLLLKPTSSNRMAICSQTTIRSGNDLILVPIRQCIFSSGFTAASQTEQMQIEETMEKLRTQYESINKDFISKMKIYIQLIASVQNLRTGSMPLRDYAEYVLSMPDTGLAKGNITSKYLLDLYHNWERSNKVTFSYMKNDLFKRVDEDEFLNVCNKGRNVIRSTGREDYLFAAPFLDKMDHSFDPNCQFNMLYLPHLRTPLIRIRTLRQINPGERATINYGKLNNYELLMRYGFCVQGNPNSVFMLPLNFENIIEIFNKNIEWKQKQLLAHKMRLKNYVRILGSGELAAQDLTMMRILICDGQDPSEDRLGSSAYDKLINKFISGHAQGMRRNIKINNLKVSTDPSIKILEDEEISILDRYLSIHGS